MCRAAEQIKSTLIVTPELTQRDMARNISISEKTLSYQLNKAHQLKDEVKEGAINYFAKHGIKLITTDNEECRILNKVAGKLLSDTNCELGMFYNEILEAIENDEIDERERCKLITIIERIKKHFVNDMEKRFDELTNLLNFGRV